MLTESEKQWIEHREAMQFLTGTYIADFEEYPLWNPGKDWQEAAEFEARVAAKLAETWEDAPSAEAMTEAYIHGNTIAWALLKIARLQVEEEMDANR